MAKQLIDIEKERGITIKPSKSSLWAEMKFPPLNLHNIWPTEAMAAIHAETQDPTLWEDYD